MQHIKRKAPRAAEAPTGATQNPKPENRFSQPLLKDGFLYEDIIKENESNCKNENTINEFKNLCKSAAKAAPATATQNIREIRKYIKRNDKINSLNTRELNEDFPINEHRFVKRNGLLTLIHDPNISTPTTYTTEAPISYKVHEHDVILNETEEQLSLKALNEKVNKIYDFCVQVQNFLIATLGNNDCNI